MSGLVSPAVIEQIRSASDIVDIIGSSVPLKRAGANFVALCPFHKEKSPSFNVNPQRQTFHCFGCNKGGDVFTFIVEYEGVSFIDAVRRLAERARIPLATETGAAPQDRHLKETLLDINEQIARRWQSVLTNDTAGQIARDYLHKRAVSEDAVKLFRLGCSPDAWDDTVNWAKSKGFELPLVEQAGLIIRKEGEDRYYDRFRGRLMFPICNEQGRVIGFSGRVLSGDEKTAKYDNSPETPIFTKGKVIFGLDKSKRPILDAQQAIVCEGQLDLIACFMAGVQNVVAPQGTALTADHARILKRYADEVVLCFDSDNAGQNATVRALDDLLASGLAIRVATVPAPHDPDSFIKEFGGDAFRQLIERAESFFDFYLNRLCATNDVASDRGRVAVARSMAEAVLKSGSAVLADTYAQKTAHRLGVAVDAVRAEFKRVKAPAKAAEPKPEAEAAPAPVARPSTHEFWLLKLLLLEDDLAEHAAGYLDPSWLQHPVVSHIISLRLHPSEEGGYPRATSLLAALPDPSSRSLVTEAVSDPRPIPDPKRQVDDLLKRLRDLFIDRQMAGLSRNLANPALGDADRVQLMQQQSRLREWKRQPLAPVDGA